MDSRYQGTAARGGSWCLARSLRSPVACARTWRDRGMPWTPVTDHVHLLADLSGWLAGRGLAAADLTGEAAGEFLGARRAAGHRCGVTAQALTPVLGYLRSVQAVPAQEQPVPATPLEELLAVYRQYLEGERGLSASTIRHYLRYARVFLSGFPGSLTPDLAGAVGRAGHRPCAGAGQARAGGRAGTWSGCPRCGPCFATCTRPGISRSGWIRQSRRGGPGDRGCRARGACRSSAGGPRGLRPRTAPPAAGITRSCCR